MLVIFVPVSIAICPRPRSRKAALRFCPVSRWRHAKSERLRWSVTGSRSCEVSVTGGYRFKFLGRRPDQSGGLRFFSGCDGDRVSMSPGLCRDRGRSGACDHLARHRWLDVCRTFVRGRQRIRATSTSGGGRANSREVLFNMDEAG